MPPPNPTVHGPPMAPDSRTKGASPQKPMVHGPLMAHASHKSSGSTVTRESVGGVSPDLLGVVLAPTITILAWYSDGIKIKTLSNAPNTGGTRYRSTGRYTKHRRDGPTPLAYPHIHITYIYQPNEVLMNRDNN